ncbi:MAG TPA: lipopolysaccharide biosynthesis protein [Gemmatimonadota bacterium]|nr:lipopolysaccharide biosynthesis protein [Gemmatimonadota bacterium]
MKDLREAALRGTIWSTIQQVGDRGLRAPLFLIMARLLPPEDFGLLALALTYVDFLQLVQTHGMGMALVQRERLEVAHLNSAFWGILVAGIVTAIAGFVTAGLFADLTGQPDVEPIVRWLSLGFILGGLCTVQGALLKRELRFKALALRSLIGQGTAGGVAIVVAVAGYGVWSLVALLLVYQVANTILLWRASDWRPSGGFSWARYRELMGFGVGITGLNVTTYLRLRADNLLVGVALGAAPLGYYSMARQLVDGLWAFLSGSVSPVLWSTLARLQEAPARLGRALHEAAEMLGLVIWPAFIGLAAVSPEFVTTVLGGRWTPTSPLLVALVVGSIARMVAVPHLTAITVTGRTGLRVAIELLSALVTLTALALALPYGVLAAAWAYSGALALLLPIQLEIGSRVLKLDRSAWLGAFGVPLLASAVMLGSVLALGWALSGRIPMGPRLAVMILTGVATYAAVVAAASPPLAGRLAENLRTAFRSSP